MVETHELTRVYGAGEQIRALDCVSLRINEGDSVAVMGPSGSGKSTLLNVLGALDTPTSGRVIVNGNDLAAMKDVDTFRSETVGFMFQLHNLLPTLTARENIEVPMMGKVSPTPRKRRAEELLSLVGLADRMNHLPSQLSGGQRQRVAAARALANHPELILADEPTGSLDTASGQELMNLLKELNRSQGVTFVIVTHDLSVARQTRRIQVMADGRIVREDIIGSPFEEDLKIWRNSGLGQRIIAEDQEELTKLGITEDMVDDVRRLFRLTHQL